ncbi:MAG: glycoside hydrolase family 3 C-terminal domain-containing protein [Bacteroidaceae bacterium]|nr:glycoside hydrolase family 3 C-terminal domain-containing protein [Bacteroidaceae bacterium]
MSRHTTLYIICTAVMLTACNGSESNGSDKEMIRQTDALYDRMSPQERVAQLRSMYMDDLFDTEGNLDTAACRRLIPNGIGHFSQYASQKPLPADVLRDRVAAVQNWLINNTPNGIPALFHEEVLSGINTLDATIYPQQIGQAGSFNTELAELKTLQTGIGMRKMGGILSLSPMVDVCRTPSFNRLEESYGEDAYLSAAMGTAFVRGLQQGDLKKGVGTCSKHYLGYGGGGDADEKELMEEILLPHETMIRLAGSKAVMPGYHSVHGTKCVANSEILIDILREYVGFDGMVVSDYTAVSQVPGKDHVEKAAAAINGGNDVDFPSGDSYAHLLEAIGQGLVSEETFARAVKDVLKYKYRAGLFDNNAYLYAEGHIELDTPKERQTSYQIATQSVVLLENNGILPLAKDSRILLTGPNASSMWAMCGDYSFPAMTYFWKRTDIGSENPHIVTLLEGLKSRLEAGSTLEYTRGCDWTESDVTRISQSGDPRAWQRRSGQRRVDSGEKADRDEALKLAGNADIIIAAMGENVLLCGENRDRDGLRLPGDQEQFVRDLIATGKPVILIMFGGRAQVIGDLADRCAAVIQAWYPGEEGGNAVADILVGNISPSAKLSVSYPNVELDEPICYNYSATQDPRIRWPFGYGLSYTTFEYSDMKLDSESIGTDKLSIGLEFTVKNIGKMKSDEIVQLYLSPTSADQPIRPIQLQGFTRVSLEPGESKTVRAQLFTDQFGYYTNIDGNRSWNIAPGTYTIRIGASSADLRLEHNVTLTGKPVTKPLRDNYFSKMETVPV